VKPDYADNLATGPEHLSESSDRVRPWNALIALN